MGLHRPGWLTRWSADPAVRVGVAGASWSIAGSFARGLLPRSPIDQAVATGVVAATNYQLSATAWAVVEALASRPGRRPNLPATVAVAGAAIAGGLAANAFGQRLAETSMPAAALSAAGRRFAFIGLAGLAGAVADDVLIKRLKWQPGLDTTLVPSIVTGAAVAGFTVLARSRRANKYGIVEPDRQSVKSANGRAIAQAAVVGVGSSLALTGLTLGEQFAAGALERGHQPWGWGGTGLSPLRMYQGFQRLKRRCGRGHSEARLGHPLHEAPAWNFQVEVVSDDLSHGCASYRATVRRCDGAMVRCGDAVAPRTVAPSHR